MTAHVIGIDPHSRVHVAAAVDEHGRCIDTCEVGASIEQLARLLDWIGRFDVTKVAVEGARATACRWHAYSLPLTTSSWTCPRI